MFNKRLATLSIVTAIIVGSTSTPNPVKAANVTFECNTYQEHPTTMAKTQRGYVPIIVWEPERWGKEFPAQERCNQVTAKLQEFNQSRRLRYLTGGWVDNAEVLCLTSHKETACSSKSNDNILLTLEPGQNADDILMHLRQLRDGGNRAPITKGKIRINLEDFLEKAPVMEQSEALTSSESKDIPLSLPSSDTSTLW